MKAYDARARFCAALALALLGALARADAAATRPDQSAPLLPGANSSQPVSIEADKLAYFDKELKAVYTGRVVVVQGDTKMTCSVLTIFMEKAQQPGRAAPANTNDPGGGTTHLKHLDALGPVAIVSKTQVATGDRAAYDKAQNKVWLIGNVTLSDGGNVTKGDKLTYDLTTGEATVDASRVKGLFIPGSSETSGDDKNNGSK